MAVLGDAPLGGEGSASTVHVSVITAKVINADFVRSVLQAQIKDISNVDLKPFIDAANDNMTARLLEWELGAYSTLTAIQQSRIKFYFAYEIGIQANLQNTELCKQLQKQQRNMLRKIIDVETGGTGTEYGASGESAYFTGDEPMSVNANAVMTLVQAKAFLKLDTTESTRDGVIETFINQLSDYLEDLLQNPVVLQNKLEYLDGSGGERLYPSFFPSLALVGTTTPDKLSNLQCRETFDGSWLDLFTSLNQFSIVSDPSKKNKPYYYRRLDGYIFPDGVRNIRLYHQAGYQIVPGKIMQAAYEMVYTLFHASPSGDSRIGIASVTENVQGQNYTTALKDMDKRWRELLAEYIRE